MRVHYTGRHADITDAEKAKAMRRFEKVQRIFGASKELEAHVILSKQRHFIEAEVTLRALQHTLVVTGQNANAFAALTLALDKLEKQAVRNKHKLVDGRRPARQRDEPNVSVQASLDSTSEVEPAPAEPAAGPRIVRGNGMAGKPLTLEEAALALEDQDRDQVTFRDTDSGRYCVLLRRRDGALELVETPA
ncbi:MAG: ribosome-associated translation inhibitor RaiA [Acidobacteria bacterium]|nr:ribosome-associated translation inhibitor RaiA [Acidobacteriota bacterium]